jgi:hypothetical protein
VTFRADAIRGASSVPGQIDYRLARRHTIAEFRRGRLSRLDVCDAHPELIRAATNVGRPSDDECPICEDRPLTLVTFVFGARLPAHGRCITDSKELAKFARRPDELACYVVEVCTECSWNHLARTFVVGGTAARASSRQA